MKLADKYALRFFKEHMEEFKYDDRRFTIEESMNNAKFALKYLFESIIDCGGGEEEIKNCIYYLVNRGDRPLLPNCSIIRVGFIWSITKEGLNFWSDVSVKLVHSFNCLYVSKLYARL